MIVSVSPSFLESGKTRNPTEVVREQDVRRQEILKAAGASEFSFFLASDWNSLTSDEAWLPISRFVTQHTLCIGVPAEEPS
jgi:hypothetical protein